MNVEKTHSRPPVGMIDADRIAGDNNRHSQGSARSPVDRPHLVARGAPFGARGMSVLSSGRKFLLLFLRIIFE